MKVTEKKPHFNGGTIKAAHRLKERFYDAYHFLQLKQEGASADEFANEVAELRVYITRAGALSVCIWFHLRNELYQNGFHESGSGREPANAYGYHKASEATEKALRMCGFVFDEGFGGAGDAKMVEAVRAALAFLGVPAVQVIHSHG